MLFRLLACLPWPLLRWIGAALGRLMPMLAARETAVARRNLALCFPELDPAQQRALLAESLRETGRLVVEIPRIWHAEPTDTLARITSVQGGALLEAAIAAPAGLIVAAPHLGNWEVLNRYLASKGPLSVLYRPPRHASHEAAALAGRAVSGVTQVRAEAAGVRQLLKTLKAGGTIGILPDQQPKAGEGVFAPFFGVPALTMTLLPRLAITTGATVLLAVALREVKGFRIHIEPMPGLSQARDAAAAAALMNAGIEAAVRRCPAQYQWVYKRFSKRPEGPGARFYQRAPTDSGPDQPVTASSNGRPAHS